MAHETVPADIAAAIDEFDCAAQAHGWESDQGSAADAASAKADWEETRAALNAAILHHLRAYDEMRAALEAQTSGGA